MTSIKNLAVLSTVAIAGLTAPVEAANLGSGTGMLSITGSVNVQQTVLDDKGTTDILDDDTFSTFQFISQVAGDPDTTVRYTATDITGAFLPFTPVNALPFINFAFGESNTGLVISSITANPLTTPLQITLDPAYQIPGNTPVLDGSDNLPGFLDQITFDFATLPVFTPDPVNGLTNVSITALGTATSGDGKNYRAEATFTTQSTMNETQFVTALRTPTGLNTSFSATMEIEEIPNTSEPGALIGLLALAVPGLLKRLF